ncbi:MAG: response regulator transcription factor [Alphaproteobacteria bacterium]|nr:response regulator transcription factor [Alphaproteobacteria bacterium]
MDPSGRNPVRVFPCSVAGWEEIAVETDVALAQAGARSRGGRHLRILVVWGARFLGESLAEILERDPLVSVVGICTDLSEAVALSPALEADVALVDARIPEGLAGVRHALDIAPGLRIVACAVRETEEDIVAWAEAGVIGYIPRTASVSDLARMILDIHAGEQSCSGRVAAGLLRRIARTGGQSTGRDTPFRAAALTKRERQAAELIRSGLSDKEIARQLNISLATTKSHVHNLLGKLNVRRRSQVADHLREYEHPH